MAINMAHKVEEVEAEQIHICRDLRTVPGRLIKVIKFENAGWYLLDESVTVKGHDANYACGIKYCPFCGENLLLEIKM